MKQESIYCKLCSTFLAISHPRLKRCQKSKTQSLTHSISLANWKLTTSTVCNNVFWQSYGFQK